MSDHLPMDFERELLSKPPPHSEADERAALGCILLTAENGGGYKELLAQLRLPMFYDLRHVAIFKTIKAMSPDCTPTTINVIERLKAKGKMQDAGELPYVAGLPDKAFPGIFGEHVAKLAKMATRRTLRETGVQILHSALDESLEPDEIAADVVANLPRLTARLVEKKEWLKFHSPSECRDYTPSSDLVLVGDFHITKGATTVIAGPPGVGKSRTGTSLALAGARGSREWLGLPVRRQFRTLILQAENGRHRLKDEFNRSDCAEMDDWIRVSEPPAFGVRFEDAGFREALAGYLEGFPADVVILDPWNSATLDDKQRDYAETFRTIKETLPKGENAPALIIIAHTRKPSGDSKRSGRSLMFDVAGSHMLTSVPRSVFNLQPATDDPKDDRVVWTNSKNNDGPLADRTAWHRTDGRFDPCENFDWGTFDGPEEKRRITEDDLRELFDDGNKKLSRTDATAALQTQTGLGRTACYDALSPTGRFKDHLSEEGKLITWKP